MVRAFRLRPITRHRIIWLAVLMLVWQQFALAAYACAMVPAGAPPAMAMSTTTPMRSMGGSCAQMAGVSNQALCQAHCAPDTNARPDPHTASVPPNLLTALPPMLPAVAMIASRSIHSPERQYHLRVPLPPARLLFCSLLI